MARAARTAERSPVTVELADLIRAKPAGESIGLMTPRVRAFASGGHLSPFKGRGVEYDESRPYQAGDDLRTMDWRVTARTGKPYTKVFREERNRPVIVWLDLRRSMHFATRGAYKSVLAADAAALVAWSAVANGDQLGGLVFSEYEHHELRPRLGRRAALRLLQLIVGNPCWRPARTEATRESDTERSLLRLTRVTRPGSIMFLMSDFRSFGADDEKYVRQLASHGDLYLIHVFDPLEAELPPPGRYRIRKDRRAFAIETSDPRARERYRDRFAARVARLQALARVPGVNVLDCPTTGKPFDVLSKRFAPM